MRKCLGVEKSAHPLVVVFFFRVFGFKLEIDGRATRESKGAREEVCGALTDHAGLRAAGESEERANG